MSEETDKIIPSVIAAAVAAAGPMGNNPGAWKGKINNAIPAIAAMMHETTRQWRIAQEVLEASVFHATYVGHEIEASSTRVIVKIDTGKATKNYPDGIEPIRTHRTDNAQGRHMLERLKSLQPGDEMMVWKAMESMGDGADANKVRVLVHFEPLPKRTDSSTPSGQRNQAVAAAPVSGGDDAVEPARGTPSPRAGSGDNPVVDRFNELPGKVKAAVVKRLRAEGISFPDPGPDHVDQFIIIINETEKDQA